MGDNRDAADAIISALETGSWSTADLVRIAHATSRFGKNTTSILGQYGEELVAAAFGGSVASFDQKAFDVISPTHGKLQVKTHSAGKRPGNIRSFEYDVITVEVDPATARVLSARRYRAKDLFERFQATYHDHLDAIHVWGGQQTDRFERGWTIGATVPYTDVTPMFHRVPGEQGAGLA